MLLLLLLYGCYVRTETLRSVVPCCCLCVSDLCVGMCVCVCVRARSKVDK